MSVCLYVSLSVSPSHLVTVCLAVCLFVCLCVCVSVVRFCPLISISHIFVFHFLHQFGSVYFPDLFLPVYQYLDPLSPRHAFISFYLSIFALYHFHQSTYLGPISVCLPISFSSVLISVHPFLPMRWLTSPDVTVYLDVHHFNLSIPITLFPPFYLSTYLSPPASLSVTIYTLSTYSYPLFPAVYLFLS